MLPFLQLPLPLHHSLEFGDYRFRFIRKAVYAQRGQGPCLGRQSVEAEEGQELTQLCGTSNPPAGPMSSFVLKEGAVLGALPSLGKQRGQVNAACAKVVKPESESQVLGSTLNELEKALLGGLQSDPQNTHYGERPFPAERWLESPLQPCPRCPGASFPIVSPVL